MPPGAPILAHMWMNGEGKWRNQMQYVWLFFLSCFARFVCVALYFEQNMLCYQACRSATKLLYTPLYMVVDTRSTIKFATRSVWCVCVCFCKIVLHGSGDRLCYHIRFTECVVCVCVYICISAKLPYMVVETSSAAIFASHCVWCVCVCVFV